MTVAFNRGSVNRAVKNAVEAEIENEATRVKVKDDLRTPLLNESAVNKK